MRSAPEYLRSNAIVRKAAQQRLKAAQLLKWAFEFNYENRARAPKISQAGGSPLGGPRSEIGGGSRTPHWSYVTNLGFANILSNAVFV